MPPTLSLDQVPGSRAVCPDQSVLVPEEEGLHSQPALRAVVRNSPMKLLAGFVQHFLEDIHYIPQQPPNVDPRESFPSGLAEYN